MTNGAVFPSASLQRRRPRRRPSHLARLAMLLSVGGSTAVLADTVTAEPVATEQTALDLSDKSYQNLTPRLAAFTAGESVADVGRRLNAKLTPKPLPPKYGWTYPGRHRLVFGDVLDEGDASPKPPYANHAFTRVTLQSYEEPGKSILPKEVGQADLLFDDDKLFKVIYTADYKRPVDDERFFPGQVDHALGHCQRLMAAVEQKYRRINAGKFVDYVTQRTYEPGATLKIPNPDGRPGLFFLSRPETRLYHGDGVVVVVIYAEPHRTRRPENERDETPEEHLAFGCEIQYIAVGPVLRMKGEYDASRADQAARVAAEERRRAEQDQQERQRRDEADRKFRERL